MTTATRDLRPPEETGLEGARRRWGEPRRINLRDCSDSERRIILASLAAIRAERVRDAAAQAQAN
jgi:hypothetical protein